MKFLALIASAFLTLALFTTPVKGECEGAPATVTKLNFFDANLTQNTLHIPGGQLRYTGTCLVVIYEYCSIYKQDLT